MIEVAEIERMSLPDRLQAMESLWASISRAATELDSPEWHQEVISSRLAKIARGEAKFLSVEQLKTRLRRSE